MNYLRKTEMRKHSTYTIRKQIYLIILSAISFFLWHKNLASPQGVATNQSSQVIAAVQSFNKTFQRKIKTSHQDNKIVNRKPNSPHPLKLAGESNIIELKLRKEIVVAVIDTGIDSTHADFKNSLWKNKKEIPNGLDDDSNGLVDDLSGWSFADDSSQLTDTHGHGTHIAGIILKQAPKAKLMILKYYNANSDGDTNLQNSIQSIRYAIENGANIINYSAGGNEPCAEEKKLLEKASQMGILVVAAAGNERSNADESPFYPAGYGLPNIIAVTAVNNQGNVLKSSNWGPRSVDIAAPGELIKSARIGGGYTNMTGTSQATAFVTGIAANLLESRNGQMEYSSIKRAITLARSPDPELLKKTRNGTQANLMSSLKTKDFNLTITDTEIENLEEIDKSIYTVP